MSKTCTSCNRDLPLLEFYKNKRNKDGYTYVCRDCRRQYRSTLLAKRIYTTPDLKTCSRCSKTMDVEKFACDKSTLDGLNSACKVCRRTARLLATYGISPEQHELLSRNGCNICGSSEGLEVDHDHSCCPGRKSCGKCIRGVLCYNHNSGLGKFQDDIQHLETAVAYLRKYECSQSAPVGIVFPLLST